MYSIFQTCFVTELLYFQDHQELTLHVTKFRKICITLSKTRVSSWIHRNRDSSNTPWQLDFPYLQNVSPHSWFVCTDEYQMADQFHFYTTLNCQEIFHPLIYLLSFIPVSLYLPPTLSLFTSLSFSFFCLSRENLCNDMQQTLPVQ